LFYHPVEFVKMFTYAFHIEQKNTTDTPRQLLIRHYPAFRRIDLWPIPLYFNPSA
jgi:hypothetical protein